MSKNNHPESIYDLLAASAVAHSDKTAITYIESVSPSITDTRISYAAELKLVLPDGCNEPG